MSKIAAAIQSIEATVGMLGLAFKPNTNAGRRLLAMRLTER